MKVYPLQCGLVVGEEAPAQGAPSAMELGCGCVGCQDACSSSRHSPLLCPILFGEGSTMRWELMLAFCGTPDCGGFYQCTV